MITQIKRWLETAFPNPTEKDQATQIGVHLEEVAEFMEAIGSHKAATILVQDVSDNFKQSPNIYKDVDGNAITLPEDFKIQMLDALCDQIVTATSVAYSMGFDIEGAIKEVNASNWSKFEDGKPLYDANGKVIKGKNYFKPNLKPYLTKTTETTSYTDKQEHFGNMLRKLRVDLCISQTGLAKALDVGICSIVRAERHRIAVPAVFHNLHKLETLGVPRHTVHKLTAAYEQEFGDYDYAFKAPESKPTESHEELKAKIAEMQKTLSTLMKNVGE